MTDLDPYLLALREHPDFARLKQAFDKAHGTEGPNRLASALLKPHPKPFQDMIIVDLSQGLAGPFAAKYFCDRGATIIKVEPPYGDWSRELLRAAIFDVANSGKLSATFNFRNRTDLDTLRNIISHADVLIEAYKPGSLSKFGLDFDSVKAIKPEIVYASVSAWGAIDPVGATDAVIGAETGLSFLNGGRPLPNFAVDIMTGVLTAQQILTALYEQDRFFPEATYVEGKLVHSAAILQRVALEMLYKKYELDPNLKAGSAPSGLLNCQDGQLVSVILTPKDFSTLYSALGQPETLTQYLKLSNAERAAVVDDVNAAVEKILMTHPYDHWKRVFDDHGLQIGKLRTPSEFYHQISQLDIGATAETDNVVVSSAWTEPPPENIVNLKVPKLGEHTDHVVNRYGRPFNGAEAHLGL